MKSANEVANHPMARLQRELVSRLRACGSTEGVERAWSLLRLNRRLWKKITIYGLDRPDGQIALKRIAFPACNWAEVDAALGAGNNLRGIYELAIGNASLTREATGSYKTGAKGLKIIKQAKVTARSAPDAY